MTRNLKAGLVPALFVALSAASVSRAEIGLSLTPSDPSPAPIGTFVTWQAEAEDTNDGTLWYRFRVREGNGAYRIIRDFGPESALLWAPIDHEGQYEVEVSVRNRSTGEVRTKATPYQMLSAAAGGKPVVSSTPNPLVYIYSAPPCAVGSSMSVLFAKEGGVETQRTPAKNCDGARSMNFYVAGLRIASKYAVWHETIASAPAATAAPAASVKLAFQTEEKLPFAPPAYSRTAGPSPNPGIMLRAALNYPSLATDLEGNVVWFYQFELTFITRPGPDSTFWGIWQNQAMDESKQAVKKFDMAGMTILETNCARINEQLEAMGKRPIGAVHHEVRELPDGKIALLAGVEQEMEDTQGPGLVNILGDTVVVLDRDLNVVWTWDAFDHIDPTRAAILGESCAQACPPIYKTSAAEANDWLHSNSLAYAPDGNLILSVRHLDVVLKLAYENGKGDGHVVWQLGKDGDFTMESDDPNPWFSHQHDVQYLGAERIILWDNGNTRRADNEEANSRGQVILLNEKERAAKLEENFDVGLYSFALGSAQKLPNGNYHFNVGFLPPFRGTSVEVNPRGEVVYGVASSTAEYRTIRMPSIYREY